MFKRFFSEEDGATMLEYGLMVVLIAIACLVAVQTVGVQAQSIWDSSSAAIAAATS